MENNPNNLVPNPTPEKNEASSENTTPKWSLSNLGKTLGKVGKNKNEDNVMTNVQKISLSSIPSIKTKEDEQKQVEISQKITTNLIKNSEGVSSTTEVSKMILRKTQNELFWGKVLSAGALIFLIVAWMVSYIALDQNNTVLGAVGVENLTVKDMNLSAIEEEENAEYKRLREEYEKLAFQNLDEDGAILLDILDNKIAWTQEMKNIDSVINKISPYNAVTHKLYFNQYSFDTLNKEINISGQLQDDSNNILRMLANTVDAFEESPYFTGIEYNRYSANEENTGSFVSPVRLSFTLKDPAAQNIENELNYTNTHYDKRRYRYNGFYQVVNESEGKDFTETLDESAKTDLENTNSIQDIDPAILNTENEITEIKANAAKNEVAEEEVVIGAIENI